MTPAERTRLIKRSLPRHVVGVNTRRAEVEGQQVLVTHIPLPFLKSARGREVFAYAIHLQAVLLGIHHLTGVRVSIRGFRQHGIRVIAP